MTTKIRWRSAYPYLPMIADGGAMDACVLGKVEVGRVQRIGKRGAWISWLPRIDSPFCGHFWHDAKTWQAARDALETEVRSFLSAIGAKPKMPAQLDKKQRRTARQKELPL